MSEGPVKNQREMDAQMRKTFSLKTEVLGGDPEDVQSIKVLNRQISWKNSEIHWKADHVEILAKHLGLEGASTVKTLGNKNDMDKTLTETSTVRRMGQIVRPLATSTSCS